jgi:hypothetical protein
MTRPNYQMIALLHCDCEFRSGSWLCENADVLRRRRMAFSSARYSSLLARGSPLTAHWCTGADISQTPWFPHFWNAARVLPFMLLCVEPSVIWRRAVPVPSTTSLAVLSTPVPLASSRRAASIFLGSALGRPKRCRFLPALGNEMRVTRYRISSPR